MAISASASTDAVTDAFEKMQKIGCVAARASWLLLAQRGDAVAQFDVGLTWEFGGDYGCDFHSKWEATKWYKMAADQGNSNAADALAFAYYTGDGAAQNFPEAMRLWRTAADKGSVDANYFIGLLFEEGKGVPQNYLEAAQWFGTGAERGDFQAQRTMGYIYENGQGVPQNNVEAYMWFNLAAAHTDVIPYDRDLVAKERDRLATKLTPAELADGQQRASRWKPK
jgi:hypothetical protein